MSPCFRQGHRSACYWRPSCAYIVCTVQLKCDGTRWLRRNWRTECVASTLHTTPEHGVSSITTADVHTSAVSSRLNWRPPADLNAVGSQYPSHYLGTWCIQHYYRWCTHLGCQQSTELPPTPGRFKWTRPFRAKDEIWFLRVCHHISNAV